MHGDTLSEQLKEFINYGSRISHNLICSASDLVLKIRLLPGLSSISGTSEFRANFERMTLAEFDSGAMQAVRSLEEVGGNNKSASVLASETGEAYVIDRRFRGMNPNHGGGGRFRGGKDAGRVGSAGWHGDRLSWPSFKGVRKC
jgi:hypothetical protein